MGRTTTESGGVVRMQANRAPSVHHRRDDRTRRSAPAGSGLSGWCSALLAMAVVAAVQLVVIIRDPSDHVVASLASQGSLMNSLAVLGSATLLYLDWRLTANEVMAWLATGLLTVGVAGTTMAAVGPVQQPGSASPVGWDLVFDLALALLVTGVVILARRRHSAPRPLATGVCGGCALALTALLAGAYGTVAPLPPAFQGAVLLILAGTVAVAVAALCRLPSTPVWFRAQVAVAGALLGASQAFQHVHAGGSRTDLLAIATGVTGAAALLSASCVFLQQAISESTTTLADVRNRLRQLERAARSDRARMHEVDATLAGIAAAARLIHESTSLEPQRRRLLERMIRSETARLHRLMDHDRRAALRSVQLDAVVEPLVERQRVNGVDVTWRPCGLTVLADRDDLAEALSILLENAARHACGSSVDVSAWARGDRVHLVVTDRGPGVPDSLRDQLFEWGARRAGSPGEGIGLSSAYQLVRRWGGDLALAERAEPGAAFVMRLRIPGEARDGSVDRCPVTSAGA